MSGGGDIHRDLVRRRPELLYKTLSSLQYLLVDLLRSIHPRCEAEIPRTCLRYVAALGEEQPDGAGENDEDQERIARMALED